jgi:hypothetical protein
MTSLHHSHRAANKEKNCRRPGSEAYGAFCFGVLRHGHCSLDCVSVAFQHPHSIDCHGLARYSGSIDMMTVPNALE